MEQARRYGLRFNPQSDTLYLDDVGIELARDYRAHLWTLSFETFVLDSQIVTTMDPRRKWDCLACGFITEGKSAKACADCGSAVKLRNPVQAFPLREAFAYLRSLCRILQEESLLDLAKSRRMLITEIICAYMLWHMMFFRGTCAYAMSQNRTDARLLISRIYGMWSRLPAWLKERYQANVAEGGDPVKEKFTIDCMDSEVNALPEGVHKSRGRTPTILFGDEVVTWKRAETTFEGFSSALEAGCQSILVSSCGPGFHARLRHDELGDVASKEKPRDRWSERSGEPRLGPSDQEILRCGHDPVHIDGTVPGMWTWRNRDNGYLVVNLHFTANPDKRDPGWINRERKRNPVAFDAEMNLDDYSLAGHRILAEFNFELTTADCRCIDCEDSYKRTGLRLHSTQSIVIPHVQLPWWCPRFTSSDPGYKHSAWVTGLWALDPQGIWHLTHCVVVRGLKVRQVKRRVYQMLEKDGCEDRVKNHIIDPASKQERAESEMTIIELMDEPPYRMRAEPPAHRVNEYLGVQEVLRMAARRTDGLFGTYIHDTAPEARDLIKTAVWTEDGRRVDDRNSDGFDMWRYLATWRMKKPLRPARPVTIDDPREVTARRVQAFIDQQRRALKERPNSEEDLATPFD